MHFYNTNKIHAFTLVLSGLMRATLPVSSLMITLIKQE